MHLRERSQILSSMGHFFGQNNERPYINVLLNQLFLCVTVQKLKQHKSISYGIHRFWMSHIDAVQQTSLSWTIHAWPYASKRCSITLKDEEAEIEVKWSRLKQEVLGINNSIWRKKMISEIRFVKHCARCTDSATQHRGTFIPLICRGTKEHCVLGHGGSLVYNI